MEDRIIVDEKKKIEDKDISDSKVTMGVIQTIGNAIDPMIQLTIETPCNYPNGKTASISCDVKCKLNRN